MEYIITGVLVTYMQFGGIYLVYFFSKFYAKDYGLSKMSAFNKVLRYAACIGIVAFIAVLASCNFTGKDEDSIPVITSQDYHRGAVVFVVLLIASLIGLEEGKKHDKNRDDNRNIN